MKGEKMKVLIIGAGRMGTRHMQGVQKVQNVEKIVVTDIKEDALNNAKATLENNTRVSFVLFSDLQDERFDICIIASVASDRKRLCEFAVSCGCEYLMIEKPLGQSYDEVDNLIQYFNSLPIKVVVNLNMRLYDPVIKLKLDLGKYKQLQGEIVVTLNTGTLGIGCNGIHYLDFLFFIMDADKAEIVAAEVDDTIIPSGRGLQFCDFGGWAVIKYYKSEHLCCTALLSMSAKSTVFGGWEIVAPFGRISIDEIAQERTTTLRKEDSNMPINRYAADYLPAEKESFVSPFLGDLTTLWINELQNGKNLLPEAKESLKVHKLMFDWLSFSKTHKTIFPIT